MGDAIGTVVVDGRAYDDIHAFGYALTIFHELFGEAAEHLLQQVLKLTGLIWVIHGHIGLPVGQYQGRIVGAGVAIDANPVEAVVDRIREQSLQQWDRYRYIGTDETEHGGHIGCNHAGTLGHTHQVVCPAVNTSLPVFQFRNRIGRHDGPGKILETVRT